MNRKSGGKRHTGTTADGAGTDRKRGLLLVFLFLLLIPAIAGCARSNDAPPDREEACPEPFSGTYVSDCGSLVFNGDGRSVGLDLTDAFAEAAGLPARDADASYVFLFHNEEWPYDQAEYCRITASGSACTFMNVPGQRTPEAITLYTPDFRDGEPVVFEKAD